MRGCSENYLSLMKILGGDRYSFSSAPINYDPIAYNPNILQSHYLSSLSSQTQIL